MAHDVTDNAAEQRFEIHVDGERAGLAAYQLHPPLIAFTHTEIDERFGGRGLGGELVGAALRSARERGLGVLPFCPFVRGYIEKHPEQLDLVPAERRASFGLG